MRIRSGSVAASREGAADPGLPVACGELRKYLATPINLVCRVTFFQTAARRLTGNLYLSFGGFAAQANGWQWPIYEHVFALRPPCLLSRPQRVS